MLNSVFKKNIFVLFFFLILSAFILNYKVFAKSSNTNYSVMKLEKITSTKCQKEVAKVCPKSTYKTSKSKLQCIEDNIDNFSDDCVRSFNIDENENDDDFLKNCQLEVSLHCKMKYNKQTKTTTIRSPKMCRMHILQHFKQASSVCQKFLYQNMSASERSNFMNMQMQKSMGISQKNSGNLFNSYTGQSIMIKRNRSIKNKKSNIHIENTKENNANESEGVIDEGFSITEDDKKKQITLTNGIVVSIADIKLFYQKYSKKMEKLGEEERIVFMNEYFAKYNNKNVE